MSRIDPACEQARPEGGGETHLRAAGGSRSPATTSARSSSNDKAPQLQSIEHLGKANQPDFRVELPDGRVVHFDITTDSPRELARHRARPYGHGLEILPYKRPDGLLPFPPHR